MRVAVIDDELQERKRMQEYFDRFAAENAMSFQVDCYADGDSLLKAYGEDSYTLLVFDIDMPGRSGIDTARLIREKDEDVTILFVTNMAQYAINGYEVQAVDYIIKPIGYYDFAMKLRRALRRISRNQGEKILVHTADGDAALRIADITYVEVMGHYIIYHTLSGVYRTRGSMKENEGILKAHQFSRAHKSFLVNLAHLENIQRSDVVVAGDTIPLGRSFKESIMQDYMQYLRG